MRGYPTTWGAEPYRDQVIDDDATVVQRLEAAGAVLIAKLTLGALAYGDICFDTRTRNPWNLEEGSSGSSAGSASAVAAGLVGFAIGTETLGSIVSPCDALRRDRSAPDVRTSQPYGAMASKLEHGQDRSDRALGRRLRGDLQRHLRPDGRDPAVVDVPFDWNPDRN